VEYKIYMFFRLHSHPTLCALRLYNVLLYFLLALWSAWLDLSSAYLLTFYFIWSFSRASVHLLSLSFALNRVHAVLETRTFSFFTRVQPPCLYIIFCFTFPQNCQHGGSRIPGGCDESCVLRTFLVLITANAACQTLTPLVTEVHVVGLGNI
jgi:hypothetical protein